MLVIMASALTVGAKTYDISPVAMGFRSGGRRHNHYIFDRNQY